MRKFYLSLLSGGLNKIKKMLKTTREADEGNPHCTKINKIKARCLDIRQLIGERGGGCVDGDEEIKGSSRLTQPF